MKRMRFIRLSPVGTEAVKDHSHGNLFAELRKILHSAPRDKTFKRQGISCKIRCKTRKKRKRKKRKKTVKSFFSLF